MTTQPDLFNIPGDPPQVVLALGDALHGARCAYGCVRGPDGTTAAHGAEPLDVHRMIHQVRATLDEIERYVVGVQESNSCFGCNSPGRLRGQPRAASQRILDLNVVKDHGVVPLCRACARDVAAPSPAA